MKTIIHVNQHIIKANAKTGAKTPPLSIKTYKGTKQASSVSGDGPFEVIYSPDKPLSCGARVWIQTTGKVYAWDNEKQEQVNVT